jgi:DnaK suppressor protein
MTGPGDAVPPTEEQLRELQRDLLALQGELAELLQSSKEASRPVDLDEPIGRLSRMDAMQQQSMVAANRRAAQLRQQQAASALGRVEDGDYGFCVSCGGTIGYRRLKARPEAPFCIGCQSSRESRG